MIELIIIIFIIYTYYYRSIFQAEGIIVMFKSRFILFLFALLLFYLLRKRIFKEFFKIINTDNKIIKKNIIEEFSFLNQIKSLTSKNNISDHRQKCIKILAVTQNMKCCICKSTLNDINYNIDFKIPFNMGGKDTIDNMQLLCSSCYKNKIAIQNYLK